jgi:hypothetical protein
MNKARLAVLFGSLYLLLFLVALHTGYFYLMGPLFLSSPLILLYMFYLVIREGKYTGKELKDDEEWGYEDADRNILGTWG